MKGDADSLESTRWMPDATVVLTPPQYRGEQGRRARFTFAMNGMKQVALARVIGAKQPVIAAWIKGANKAGISLANRKKLAEILGTTVEWLEGGTGVIPERLRLEMLPVNHALLFCRLAGYAYQNAQPNGMRKLTWRISFGVPSSSMSAAEWIKTGRTYGVVSPDHFSQHYPLLVEIYSAPESITLSREQAIALMLRHGRDHYCDVAGEPAPTTLLYSASYHVGMDLAYMKRWPEVVAISLWGPEPLRAVAKELLDIRCELHLPSKPSLSQPARQQREARDVELQQLLTEAGVVVPSTDQ